jgi:4-alpha-glucanotransferase
MPVFCLPSPHGIGTFGREAFAFVDFLAASQVKIWQMLPLNVTSYGDSPYQSPSANGLNYYFIDLDLLVTEGLLTPEEIAAADFGSDPQRVDYGKLFLNRIPLLKKAFARFDKTDPAFAAFEKEGTYKDFAFFMTLKAQFNYRPWYEWDGKYRDYTPGLEKNVISLNLSDYLFYIWTQFEFLKQYNAVKDYAHFKGISILGDMPLYLARDSVEAYKYPEMFLFDKKHDPILVAGCPPDAFSAGGQLWGNPIYDWAYMEKTGFQWMNERIAYNLKIFDILRIDHFRGISGYYTIPFGRPDAVVGEWKKGPGFALFKDKTGLPIIAEDLGYLDDDVKALLKASTYPGMKILEFAYDGDPANMHKLANTAPNFVCYTGTHDNMPIYGYLLSLKEKELEAYKSDVKKECEQFKVTYADRSLKDLAFTTVRLCYASPAYLAVLPIQDLLGLDNQSRINHPSTLSSANWTYRTVKADFTPELTRMIKEDVEASGRA